MNIQTNLNNQNNINFQSNINLNMGLDNLNTRFNKFVYRIYEFKVILSFL